MFLFMIQFIDSIHGFALIWRFKLRSENDEQNGSALHFRFRAPNPLFYHHIFHDGCFYSYLLANLEKYNHFFVGAQRREQLEEQEQRNAQTTQLRPPALAHARTNFVRAGWGRCPEAGK